jgi:hypothetical protein
MAEKNEERLKEILVLFHITNGQLMAVRSVYRVNYSFSSIMTLY